MVVYENELLGFFFAPLGTEKVELSRHLGPDGTDNLRRALAEALVEAQDPLLVETAEASIDVPSSFKSVLFRGGGPGERRKVVTFSFKDGFSDSALPLLGILVAVFGGPLALGTGVAAAGAVRTLWQKLVILREPEDAAAIRVLDAVGRVGAAKVAEGARAPTWQDILAATGLDEKAARTALGLLRTRKVVDVESWGDQAEDLDHPLNRWKVRL
ncbi:hypothetical protein [Reyranella sp.]|uniref:hypothetical protein n=1 Tax=Reyranella sp. TaxID=1929291 RepID=UPI003BA8801C